MKYKIKNEYINIDNYSPFCHINEVSDAYKYNKFLLPIVKVGDNVVPIHPDTFDDLKIAKENILYHIEVYPTASFRTVYYKDKNIFIKLPITRNITRGIRTLPNEELIRAKKALTVLKEIKIEHFYILEEIPVFNNDDRFNFIIRKLPNKKVVPLFTIIKRRSLSSKKMMFLIERMIDIWLSLATKGVFLEFHTQNILIDKHLNVYYRDLSDVRSIKFNIKPSYNIEEVDLMTLSFDKTFCEQNLSHIIRYYDKLDLTKIKKYIKTKIEYHGLKFPNYSLGFSQEKKERIPIRKKLSIYRK